MIFGFDWILEFLDTLCLHRSSTRARCLGLASEVCTGWIVVCFYTQSGDIFNIVESMQIDYRIRESMRNFRIPS